MRLFYKFGVISIKTDGANLVKKKTKVPDF